MPSYCWSYMIVQGGHKKFHYARPHGLCFAKHSIQNLPVKPSLTIRQILAVRKGKSTMAVRDVVCNPTYSYVTAARQVAGGIASHCKRWPDHEASNGQLGPPPPSVQRARERGYLGASGLVKEPKTLSGVWGKLWAHRGNKCVSVCVCVCVAERGSCPTCVSLNVWVCVWACSEGLMEYENVINPCHPTGLLFAPKLIILFI